METKAIEIPNTLIFGCPGGNFSPIQDTGDQVVVFKGGGKFDSIQIGKTRYGGKGGGEQGRAKLPPNGVFRLKELQTKDSVICYMRVVIDGNTIEVGKKHNKVVLNVDLAVKFSGISSGNYVDQIQFDLVPSE